MDRFSDEAKAFATEQVRLNPDPVDGVGAWDRWHELAAEFDARAVSEETPARDVDLVA